MSLKVDLHLHTTASDGRWPPEQLLAQVRQTGIGLFAVTDHDSLDSLAAVARLVRGSGLRFLPGVEVTSQLNGRQYHLLVYGVDTDHAPFRAMISANRISLNRVGDEAVYRLIEAGYPLSPDEYETYTWDRRRGGWKSLNFLIDRGYCSGVKGYFALFQDIPLPQADFVPMDRVLAAAQQAGGVVVLAHPGAYLDNGVEPDHLDRFVEMGVQGIECFSSYHDARTTRDLLAYARRRDLLITGGSDSHGGFAGRELGQPPVYLDDLRLGVLSEMLVT